MNVRTMSPSWSEVETWNKKPCVRWTGRGGQAAVGRECHGDLMTLHSLLAHDHTERLCLREPMRSDLDDIQRIHRDPATNTYNPRGPMSLGQCRTMLDTWIQQWRSGAG